MSSFESIPWCAALLQQPGVDTFTPMARLPADANGHYTSQDQLFRTNLKTSDTVPEYLVFYQSPYSDAGKPHLKPSSPSTTGAGAGPQLIVNTASLLIDLRPGVNGFNGTAHGGLIACLFDEAMGCLLFLNGVVQKEILASGATLPDNVLNLGASPVFTATMNVKFIKPVTTPQVVMATATLERIDGRKLFLNYTLRNGDGIEFARGEGVWMMTRNEKL